MFKKGNTAAKKDTTKDALIVMRVTSSFKTKVMKASGKGGMSQYILSLIENNLERQNEKETN